MEKKVSWLISDVEKVIISEESAYLVVLSRENRKYGLCSAYGEIILEREWDDIIHFYDDLILVKRKDKYGLQKLDKSTVLDPEWDSIEATKKYKNLREQSYCYIMVKKDGKYGVYAKSGTICLQPEWDSIMLYRNDIFLVEKNGKYSLRNSSGDLLGGNNMVIVGGFSSKITQEWNCIDKDEIDATLDLYGY